MKKCIYKTESLYTWNIVNPLYFSQPITFKNWKNKEEFLNCNAALFLMYIHMHSHTYYKIFYIRINIEFFVLPSWNYGLYFKSLRVWEENLSSFHCLLRQLLHKHHRLWSPGNNVLLLLLFLYHIEK